MATQQSPAQFPVGKPAPPRKDPPRVGIKLRPNAKERQQKDPRSILEILDQARAGTSSGARAYRLFPTRTPQEIDALLDRAEQSDRTYKRVDLNAWWQVYLRTADPGPGQSPPSFSDDFEVDSLLVDLLKHEDVDNAYALRTGPPPGIQFDNGYLDTKDKRGLDVLSAWRTIDPRNPTGMTAGQGVKLVDIEGGWYKWDQTRPDGSHYDEYNVDLPDNIISLNTTNEDLTRWHGSNVLGIIFMKPNNLYGTGIAPAGQAYTMCQTFNGPADNEAEAVNIGCALVEAILEALDAEHQDQYLLRPGDVILLETSTAKDVLPNVPEKLPSECEPPVFALIRIATALGIIVVEAAGNSGLDLATIPVGGKLVFDKKTATDFRDSGAIMVGACDPSNLAPWTTSGTEGSSFGERVDVYAWGDSVATTGTSGPISNDIDATPEDFCPRPESNIPAFGGTSAAAAIIAGTIMLIQSYAQQQNGLRYTPSQMRDLLKAGGTPSEGEIRNIIGVMPNLATIMTQIKPGADIYLRHNANDAGDSTQTLSMTNSFSSPDIMLNASGRTQTPNLYNPGAAQNTISISLHNRGKAAAPSATVHIYWTHKPDLTDLTKWTSIGTADIGTVPPHTNSTDGVAVASLFWPSNAAPTGDTSNLCLIAVATCPTDAGISVANIADALSVAGTVPVRPDLGDVKQKLYLELLQSGNNISQVGFGVRA